MAVDRLQQLCILACSPEYLSNGSLPGVAEVDSLEENSDRS